nr:MAG TPA: hypothetical protein [Caudoviricetes sp.]
MSSLTHKGDKQHFDLHSEPLDKHRAYPRCHLRHLLHLPRQSSGRN